MQTVLFKSTCLFSTFYNTMKHEKMDFNSILFYLVYTNKVSRESTSKKFPTEAVDLEQFDNCCFYIVGKLNKNVVLVLFIQSLSKFACNVLPSSSALGQLVGIFQKNAIIHMILFALDY